MTDRPAHQQDLRVLYIGYNTHDEAVAKGLYDPTEPRTYDTQVNFQRAFSRVTYAVAFGKADIARSLTPEITYRERGRLLPRLPRLLRLVLELPSAILFLDRAAREARPDVVVVCGPNLAAFLAPLVPRLWRVPKLCFIEAFWETLLHEQHALPAALRAVLPLWYRLVYRLFDGYVGTPSLDEQYYTARGMRAERIGPWVNVIDLPLLDSLSADDAPQAVHPLPRPRLVSVGRLHPEKLSLDAFEIFEALARQGFGGSLVLVGDGPLRDQIMRRAAEAGLASRVLVTGFLPLPVGYRVVKACDLYIATMQGNALKEAMAAALPIVAYDNRAHRAIITDGRTGIIVPDRDVGAAAAAIAALLAEPARAQDLARAARAEIDRTCSPEALDPILNGPIRAIARRQPIRGLPR